MQFYNIEFIYYLRKMNLYELTNLKNEIDKEIEKRKLDIAL